MKTLMFSSHRFAEPFLTQSNNKKHDLIYTEQSLNINTAELAKGCEAITLFTSDIGSAEVLEKLSQAGVKYISLRSVGYDHIDLTKARSLKMKVANVPAYSPYSIAEHSVALLMALTRKIILGDELMRKDDFRLDQLVGFDLHGKTVGIVGTGKIGSAFGNIMHGFGCTLLGYDVEKNNELIRDAKITYTSFEELCQSSDVISVHCPLNGATKYLFNKGSFAHMKKGVVFINTARGGIVNTVDLLDALESGIVGFAGLDVYEYEKPIFFYDHKLSKIDDALFQKLRNHPRVLLTGHQAFLTNEALTGIADTTIANLDAWAAGGISKNQIS
ncbi:MAG: 2-hydroxyacid dehydrogenase [Bacteroidota bacterium]